MDQGMCNNYVFSESILTWPKAVKSINSHVVNHFSHFTHVVNHFSHYTHEFLCGSETLITSSGKIFQVL